MMNWCLIWRCLSHRNVPGQPIFFFGFPFGNCDCISSLQKIARSHIICHWLSLWRIWDEPFKHNGLISATRTHEERRRMTKQKQKKKQNMSKTSSRLDRIIMQAICIWTRCDASFYANFRCEKIEWDPCVCVCVINMYFMGAWMSCSRLWFRFSVARLHSREAQTKKKPNDTCSQTLSIIVISFCWSFWLFARALVSHAVVKIPDYIRSCAILIAVLGHKYN